MRTRNIILWVLLTYFYSLSLINIPIVSAQPAGPSAPGKQTAEQFVSIDFNNVDINLFIKFMSELTGTNFVVDNNVKGKVTIISPARISLDEAYRVFESVRSSTSLVPWSTSSPSSWR